MKNLVFIFLILHISLTAQNGQKNFIDQNYIELTGKVETEITPDEIYITIVLNEKDKRGKTAIEDQEIQMVKSLKSIGIDTDKDLTIQNFYGTYNSFFLRKNGVIKNKQFELLVKNTSLLSQAFHIFDTLEISNATISRVSHSQIEKFRKESKIKALKIAKEKANAYANAINQHIGKALFIKEIGNNQRRNYNTLNENIVIRGYSSRNFQPNKILDKIAFKKIKISTTILAKFELL